MKIKDLIKKLEHYDENKEIYFNCIDDCERKYLLNNDFEIIDSGDYININFNFQEIKERIERKAEMDYKDVVMGNWI